MTNNKTQAIPENKLESSKKEVSSPKPNRPWQGTVLALINLVIMLAMLATMLIAILNFAGVTNLHPLSKAVPLWQLMSFFASPLATLIQTLILGSVMVFLEFHIIKGVFVGKRWVLYLLIGLILILFSNRYYFFFAPIFLKLIILVVIAALIYLVVTCLMHPFYKQNIQTPSSQ